MKACNDYLKIVQWSEDDGCYVGKCPGVLWDGVHGNDEAVVYKELCDIAAETIELYKTDAGRFQSQQLPSHIPADLYFELKKSCIRCLP